MKSKFSKLLAIVLCLVMAVGSVAAVVEGDVPLNAETPVTETVVDEAVPETAVDETAAEEAPIVAAPSDPAAVPETLSEGETPVCTCPDVEGVDKTAADYVHLEGCPLYVAPAEPATEGEFDAELAKATLLACESVEAVDSYLVSLTDEQAAELLKVLSEEEIRQLAERLGIDLSEQVETPATDYTAVGPLMPAISVASKKALMNRTKMKALEEENGLVLDKASTYDAGNGTATITMEAYTTGEKISSNKSTPCDIVMVLDESGSMGNPINQYSKVYSLNTGNSYYVKSGSSYIKVHWCDGGLSQSHLPGWYSERHYFLIHGGTRYDPMTSATDSTSGHVQFYESSSTTKRAALISAATSFAENVSADATANNVDHRISVIGFSNNSTIKIGLVADIRSNIANVKSAISGLGANGGTYIEQGMANAINVFDNAAPTSNTQRKRVVVVFTDGIPGSGTWSDTTITDSANPAIAKSKTLKTDYGATVYSIGMLDDANPELAISDESNNSSRTNKFLHYLSSNYPYATSMSNGGAGSNAGYYLSASGTASLTAIFEKISQEISTPSIQLGSDTEIRDVVSQYFTIPDNATVRLYTAAYTGNGAFAAKTAAPSSVMATVSGDTVSVTGFDYNANFIYDKEDGSFGGKKLIIEFTVNAKDGFWGGNNVPTNDAASGVYTGDTCIENFEQPEVNVPISVPDITATDKNIYLLNTAPTATELCNYAAPTEAWKTAFVNVTGPTADKTVSNTADTADITLTVTASPKYDGTGADGTPATAVSKTATASVNVFRPTVTYQDSSIYLGETAPAYETANYKSTAWMHGDTRDTTVTMTDAKPTLAFAYAPAAAAFEKDTDVEVAVQIGATDVTEYTKFVNADDASTGHQFTVKVKTCTLTITKSGAAGSGEGFIFDVTGAKNLTVSVQDNGTVKITGLPIGDYTVTEQGGWSWRYTASSTGTATLGKDNPNGSVTMNNTRTDNTLLDGSAYAQNNSAAYTAPVTK